MSGALDLFGEPTVRAPEPRRPAPSPAPRAATIPPPHLAPIPNSKGRAFIHPCSVCGSRLAPFGEGYDGRKGTLGTWYCRAHRPRRLDEAGS